MPVLFGARIIPWPRGRQDDETLDGFVDIRPIATAIRSLCRMTSGALMRGVGAAVLTCAAIVLVPKPVSAHPHVFIESSVDFLVDDQGALTGLSVTWRYDPFETLYVLASIGITPAQDGSLSAASRAQLVKNESNWPDDFDGSSHVSVDGTDLTLSRPQDLEADLEDGRLVVQYRRDLPEPVAVEQHRIEVAVYEATYFYSVSVASAPRIIGAASGCSVALNPFDEATVDASLQGTLAALGREDNPEDANVGALFADRIIVSCG